ncbi:hypothetical protein ACFXA3_00940 [Streptomyces sp. NPDC059456]|uniref:hypothetical protein n=1 Tax=Streptomyces sp. NPDC059456 TaxID=3346838 RepID=UPI0036CD292D
MQAADLLLVGPAGSLTERIHAQAPQVDVVFLPESVEGGPGLRQGWVDVELGVLGHLDPEIRTRQLTRMPLVGIARSDHPIFDGRIGALAKLGVIWHRTCGLLFARRAPVGQVVPEQRPRPASRGLVRSSRSQLANTALPRAA